MPALAHLSSSLPLLESLPPLYLPLPVAAYRNTNDAAATSPTLVQRQAPDSTSPNSVIIPTTYHDLSSSPSPGVVVGIVLGSVGGFLFLLFLLYAALGCGFSFGPAIYSTRVRRRRRGESDVEVTVMEEVDESIIGVRRSEPRRSRRSGRDSNRAYAARTRESVDIVEDGGPIPRGIPVPGAVPRPPPPPQSQSQPRRSRGGGGFEDEDEVVVIEEHEGPRRKKKSRRRSGGEGSRERRRSRRESELSEVDVREVRRSVSRRRYSGDG